MQFLNLQMPLLLLMAGYWVLLSFFAPGIPISSDTASFLLGLKYFALTDGSPEAPGGYLLLVLVRAASALTGDGYSGLLLVSRLFSLLGLWAMYRAGRFLQGRTAGLLAAFLFAANPFVLSIAIAGNLQVASIALMAVGLYFAIRTIRDPDPVGLFRFSILLGISGGFSLLTILALLPVWGLLGWRSVQRKEPFLSSLLVVFFLTLVWWVPSLSSAGGLAGWLRLCLSPFQENIQGSLSLLLAWAAAFFWGCVPLLMAALLLLKKAAHAYRGRLLRHFVALSLPAFLLSLFQLSFSLPPTALLLLPPALALFCAAPGALLFSPEENRAASRRFLLLGVLVAVPGLVFFGFAKPPTNTTALFKAEDWSYPGIRERVAALEGFRREMIPFSEDSSEPWVVVVADRALPASRTIGYLLPDAEVHDFTALLKDSSSFHVLFQRHRRFPLPDQEVELQGKRLLFLGEPPQVLAGITPVRTFVVAGRKGHVFAVSAEESFVSKGRGKWAIEKKGEQPPRRY